MISQAELPDIAALRRGDNEAVSALWRCLHGPALRLAWYWTGDRDEAEDVVQTAILKALRHLEGYDPGRDFGPWFQRILINTCRDWKRAAFRRLRDAWTGEERESGPALHPVTGEDLGPLQELVRQLPRRMRMVFVLRFIEEHPVRTVADILDISEDTVRVMSMQARRRLRLAWERLTDEEGM